jgi:hypothetical protein
MRSILLIRAVTSTKYITNDHHGRDVHHGWELGLINGLEG